MLRKGLLWAVLAIPAAMMLHGWTLRGALPMDLLHPSGEWSLRLMVLAMLPGPLADAFGRGRFLRGWLAARRNLGVAAFLYGVLHLIFYGIDMGTLAAILDEALLPAIWTGWVSFFLMLALAATSFDAAMRALGRRWKMLQRAVYAALLLALAHWYLLDGAWPPVLIHGAPVAAAWALRAFAHFRSPSAQGAL